MELWKIVLLAVVCFDIGFVLGAWWFSREVEAPCPYKTDPVDTVEYLMRGEKI